MKFRMISSLAVAAVLMPAAAHADGAGANAANGAASDALSGGGSDIVVSAARLEKTARQEQKIAPNLIDIQPAETIAKYPDVNAAEALSRIPGVALSIDTSEGRFVNIRGLDGNLDGATLGGVVLLNTQPGGTYFNAAGRAVEFDTVPIGAIDRIEVIKTGLPDHDAEGIGGSVELTPRTAIGANRLFANVTLGGGIETLRDKGLFRDEVTIGGPLGPKNEEGNSLISFVVTQYLHDDHRSFYDTEEGYVDNQPTVPDKAYQGLEQRNYDYYRQRFGYAGEVDVTPNALQRFYLRASLAGYNEHVYRNRLLINFPSPDNAAFAPGSSTVLTDTGYPAKTLRDEDETHKNLVLQLGGDNHLGKAHLEYFGAYSRATYDKHFDYNSEFDNPQNQNTAAYGISYDNISNPNYPSYTVTSGTGFLNPANFYLNSINNSVEHDRDEEWSYAASLALPVGLASGDEVKLGAKLRYRHKTAGVDQGNLAYTGSLTWAQDAGGPAITNFYNHGYNIGPDIGGPAIRSIFDASGTALTLQPGSYFDDNEDVTAGFVQYQGSFGQLGVLAGVRFEHTYDVYRGIGSVNGAGQLFTSSHSYDDVFPTLQLRWQASPRAIARATYSTGLARPGFYQTQLATNININVGAGTVSTGNPNLVPTYSHNFDLALQYYLPDSGIVSVGGFDKEMLDYIVARTLPRVNGYDGYAGLFTVQTYENARHAHARGIEGSFVDKFRSLPGMLSGLGIDANITYVASGVAVRAGEGDVQLPGSFPWSWNAAVFWEKGPTKLRLASQFESSVLFGVGGSRATDVFQDSRYTLDFNGTYDLSHRVEFYLDAKNLTNAPLRFYEGSPNRPVQREFYDLTLEAGVKLKF